MKNSTINKLLYVAICFLALLILFLIYQISTRPHYISTLENEIATIAELTADVSALEVNDSSEAEETVSEPVQTYGKTAARANIRELPSTDSRVLNTVDKDYTFEVLEILPTGWTKIKYEDSEAYISSEFVILVQN